MRHFRVRPVQLVSGYVGCVDWFDVVTRGRAKGLANANRWRTVLVYFLRHTNLNYLPKKTKMNPGRDTTPFQYSDSVPPKSYHERVNHGLVNGAGGLRVCFRNWTAQNYKWDSCKKDSPFWDTSGGTILFNTTSLSFIWEQSTVVTGWRYWLSPKLIIFFGVSPIP